MPGSIEKKIFKGLNAFLLYYLYGHALAIEPLPRGHEIYNFVSPYPTDATYQIYLRLTQ